MSTYPLSHSDIQCGLCFDWFRLDGDLIDHRQQWHNGYRPVVSDLWRS